MHFDLGTVLLSFGVAITTALLTSRLTQGRERQAEWRKVKLAHYQELLAAISGIVGNRHTGESEARYWDAYNTTQAFAPASVINALHEFQEEISTRNLNRSQEGHDRKLTALIKAIRSDILPGDQQDAMFRMLGMGKPSAERDA